MLLLLLLSADCTETNGRKCGRWRLVHHYRHRLQSLVSGQASAPADDCCTLCPVRTFTKILVARSSPLGELLVQ
jgi:hypothetical protein